jgi:hypothetical protein
MTVKVPTIFTPYRELLLTNGAMLAILCASFSVCLLVHNLEAFFWTALGCCLLEMLFFLRALVIGQLRLAVGYALLTIVVACLDWWALRVLSV